MKPTTIKREVTLVPESGESHGVGLTIVWTDGSQNFLSSELLRRSCPCASCRDHAEASAAQTPKRAGASKLKVLQASADEAIDLMAVWAVGNYAIGLRFADKHDSGIFSFELLHKLCEKQSNAQSAPS